VRLLYSSHRKKRKKENSVLSITLVQKDLTDNYTVFHPAATQYTFFSAAHGTFCKLDHVLGQKASPNKYKKIEITPCILSDYNGMKLQKKVQKIFKHLILNNTFLHDQ
jgi:hypothetical protein